MSGGLFGGTRDPTIVMQVRASYVLQEKYAQVSGSAPQRCRLLVDLVCCLLMFAARLLLAVVGCFRALFAVWLAVRLQCTRCLAVKSLQSVLNVCRFASVSQDLDFFKEIIYQHLANDVVAHDAFSCSRCRGDNGTLARFFTSFPRHLHVMFSHRFHVFVSALWPSHATGERPAACREAYANSFPFPTPRYSTEHIGQVDISRMLSKILILLLLLL